MNWQLTWNSGALNSLQGVYQKAEQSESLAKQLADLEQLALDQARALYDPVVLKADPTQPAFDDLSSNDLGSFIVSAGQSGINRMNNDISTFTISVELSEMTPMVYACTFFVILNKLQELEEVDIMELARLRNVEKLTLELVEPLGGRKGLFPWIMLTLQLYPWVHVKEESSNILARELADGPMPSQPSPAPQPEPKPEPKPEPEPQPAKKKGFLARLFGK